jgi:hypothetical protein
MSSISDFSPPCQSEDMGLHFGREFLWEDIKKKEGLCHWMTFLVVYQWRMMICGSNMALTFPPTSSEGHFNLLPIGREVGVCGQHGVCVCSSWPIVIKSGCECVEKKNQLDVTECFIALMIRSTCFGHFYVHHQELESICVLLPPMVCSAVRAKRYD